MKSNMTFLETQQKMAREKLTPLWDCYSDCEGTQQCLMEEDLDTLVKTIIENTIKHLNDSGVLEEKVFDINIDDGVHIKTHNTAVRAVKKELEALIN